MKTILSDYYQTYKHGRCIVCSAPITKNLVFNSQVYRDDFSTCDTIYTCRRCGTGYSYPFYTETQLNKIYKNYSGYTHDDKISNTLAYRLLVYIEEQVMTACLSTKGLILKKFLTFPFFTYLFQTYPLFTTKTATGIKILDIGCGGGHFLKIAQKAGCTAYGTEIDKKLVKKLRSHGIRAYLDLEAVAKLHTKFDIVRLNHVVEHLVDPNTELKRAHKFLKKNGELIIGVPNYETLIRLCGGYMFLHLPFHRTHHTIRGLTHLMRNNGFRVVYVRTKSSGIFSRSFLRIFRLNSSIYTIPVKLLEMFSLSPLLDLFKVGDSIELYAKRRI